MITKKRVGRLALFLVVAAFMMWIVAIWAESSKLGGSGAFVFTASVLSFGFYLSMEDN